METLINISNAINPNGELNFAAAAVIAIFSYIAFKNNNIRVAWFQLILCLLNVMVGILATLI